MDPQTTVAVSQGEQPVARSSRSNALTDLGLILPLFVAYHLGVVLLEVRNAADLVTPYLRALADRHIGAYWGLTLALGGALSLVLWLLGRGETFEIRRFVLVGLEGVIYAALMRAAGAYVVGALPLTVGAPPGLADGIVMAMGAGLYEELAFRVVLFGGGSLLIGCFFGSVFKLGATVVWALLAALIFSGWHYVGTLGEPFELRSFVFRAVCGAVLTAIWVFRGLAPAVWTHVLYDVWVHCDFS